jgi:dipeptidyl aminopeptidase/acylaminoacyl peptidase
MLSLILAFTALSGQQVTTDTLLTVSRYLDLEDVGDVRISPSGGTIVYTRRWVDKVNDKWESAIWMMDADGSRNRFLVKGGGPVWSPDGSRIAYVAASEEPKGAQIFVRYMDAEGATSQVTRLAEGPSSLRWSPDGKWIGFVMFTPKAEDWAIEMPAAPANAKWTAPPKVVDKLHYRMDRAGLSRGGFNHLYVVPADGGTARQVTTGDWSLGAPFDALTFGAEWSWLPDGKSAVIEGLAEGDGDMNYRDSNIYLVDIATGKLRRLTPDRGRHSTPSVSPDGSKIVFASHAFTKQTYKTQDLFVMNADGTNLRNISGGMDRDPTFFGISVTAWAPDGSGVYIAPEDRGSRNVVFLPLDGSGPKPVTTGPQVITLGGITKTGVLFGTRTAFTKPSDVVRITRTRTGADVAQLTNVNEDLLTGTRLADAEEIWYTSSGGARVQGWIVKPLGFERGKQYPMLLEIHGGPHGMYNVGFDYMWQTWAANGYVVLFTNPRGSTGYGTDFGNAIDQAYPSVDYDDLIAGVDSVVARGYVDKSRMYVAGCSGGGVLSSWVIGHTDRFAGAAVRCPVTNWLSFAGHTDVPLFTHNFFGAPFWEKPEQWLKQSPIMYVGNVKTPTVIMTGNLDLRTPMPQSEEYYAALKMRGIPTTLLRFENEWHGTESMPSNWMRTQLYMMSWFSKHPGKQP